MASAVALQHGAPLSEMALHGKSPIARLLVGIG